MGWKLNYFHVPKPHRSSLSEMMQLWQNIPKRSSVIRKSTTQWPKEKGQKDKPRST